MSSRFSFSSARRDAGARYFGPNTPQGDDTKDGLASAADSLSLHQEPAVAADRSGYSVDRYQIVANQTATPLPDDARAFLLERYKCLEYANHFFSNERIIGSNVSNFQSNKWDEFRGKDVPDFTAAPGSKDSLDPKASQTRRSAHDLKMGVKILPLGLEIKDGNGKITNVEPMQASAGHVGSTGAGDFVMKFVWSSAFPSFQFEVPVPELDRKKVTCRIPFASLALKEHVSRQKIDGRDQTTSYWGPALNIAFGADFATKKCDPRDRGSLESDAELTKMLSEGKIIEFDFTLKPQDTKGWEQKLGQANADSLFPSPQFPDMDVGELAWLDGLSSLRLEQLLSAEAGHSRNAIMLACIRQHARRFVVYMEEKSIMVNGQLTAPMMEYTMDLANAAATHGNCWYWKLMAKCHGQRIFGRNPDVPWGKLPLPYWLGRRWEVRRLNGKVVNVDTTEYNYMGIVRRLEPTEAAFMSQLGIMREAQQQAEAIRQLMVQPGKVVTASFVKNEKFKGAYVAAIMLGEDNPDNPDAREPNTKVPVMDTVKPQTGTRVCVSVMKQVADQDIKDLSEFDITLTGFVCENAFDDKVTSSFFALLNTREYEWSDHLQARHSYIINIEFFDNTVSRAHEMGAIDAIKLLPPMDCVVDAQALILDTAPRNKDTGGLPQDITDLMFDEAEATVRHHGLSDGTLNVSRRIISKKIEHGVVLLAGCPGAGKSSLLTAALDAIAANLNLSTLVCANVRSAVQHIFDKYMENRLDTSVRVAFYDTTVPSRNRENISDGTEDASMVDSDAYWATQEQISMLGSNTKYHRYNLDRLFEEWVDGGLENDPIAVKQRRAKYKHWRQLVDKYRGKPIQIAIQDDPRTAEELAIARKDIYELRKSLYSYHAGLFKIIFATNNSSGYKTLREGFKPCYIIMDEAGLANTGSTAVPIASNYDSCHRIVLVGDPRQRSTLALSSKRNEALAWSRESRFKMLIDNRQYSDTTFYLNNESARPIDKKSNKRKRKDRASADKATQDRGKARDTKSGRSDSSLSNRGKGKRGNRGKRGGRGGGGNRGGGAGATV